MVTIRQALIEDAPALCIAEQETARTAGFLVSQPGELLPESFASLISKLSDGSGRYVVAEKAGNIVGHAFLKPMDLRATCHVFVLTIVVHPGHTSHGIGSAIMEDLTNWAQRTSQVRKIELCVRSTNTRARHLYGKFGFLEEGCFRNRISLPDGKFIDDIAMAWFPK